MWSRLSPAALTVLGETESFRNGGVLIFPSPTGKVMSDSTMSKLMKENDLKGTPHGFRSSFRDWCAETGKLREDAEHALSHKVGGVEGAYQRSTLLERRKVLMAKWAAYIGVR